MGFKYDPNDNLFNRRKFAVLGTVYMIIWGVAILVCKIKYNLDTSDVVAFLGYTTTVTSAPVVAYLLAANKADRSSVVKSITQKTDGQETSVVTTEQKGQDLEPPTGI